MSIPPSSLLRKAFLLTGGQKSSCMSTTINAELADSKKAMAPSIPDRSSRPPAWIDGQGLQAVYSNWMISDLHKILFMVVNKIMDRRLRQYRQSTKDLEMIKYRCTEIMICLGFGAKRQIPRYLRYCTEKVCYDRILPKQPSAKYWHQSSSRTEDGEPPPPPQPPTTPSYTNPQQLTHPTPRPNSRSFPLSRPTQPQRKKKKENAPQTPTRTQIPL